MKIDFTEKELEWLIPLLLNERTQVAKLIDMLGGHKEAEKYLKIIESLLDKFEG